MLLFLYFIMLIHGLHCFTQSKLEELRNDSGWIVGKGVADSDMQADRAAIMDLLSQISIQVQASSTQSMTEINGSVAEYWESAIKTYSNTQLEGAERRVFESGNRYTVYRFIRRQDYTRIFEEREQMLKNFINHAMDAEKSLRIGDALNYYYWALLLLRTHPEVNRMEQVIDGKPQKLVTWLPEQHRIIFRNLKIEVTERLELDSEKLTQLGIRVFYQQQAVQNLDFRYYHGNNWSVPISVNEGSAMMEFYCLGKDVPNRIRIDIVYDYTYKAHINQEIVRIRQDLQLPLFSESRIELSSTVKETNKAFQPKIELKPESTITAVPKQELYIDKAKELSTLIQNKDYAALEKLCTPNGKEYIKKILQYGNARPSSQSFQISIEEQGNSSIIRGIPLQFSFPRSGRSFNESLAIHYDSEGKIERLNLALSQSAVQDIMKSVKADQIEKQRIISFVEDYKTAYSLKDLSFIEKVFSENAIIIVGSMLKDDPTPIDGMYKKLGQNWRASRYSKSEYVANLRRVFAANEFVNLSLEDNVITRTNDPNSQIYGIQIRQNYYSQNYADTGYLFLMFDLNDVDNPKIYVRTWQPEKNPDGSIYGLHNFFIDSE